MDIKNVFNILNNSTHAYLLSRRFIALPSIFFITFKQFYVLRSFFQLSIWVFAFFTLKASESVMFMVSML